jgi:hypothetical protein
LFVSKSIEKLGYVYTVLKPEGAEKHASFTMKFLIIFLKKIYLIQKKEF